MIAAARGLEEAHARRQDHRQRDRHLHGQTPAAQRLAGGLEERLAGIDDRREGDHGREPVQQVSGGRPHVLEGPGPNRHGQQHHVAGGKTGHRQGAQQESFFPPVAAGELLGVERDGPIAEPLQERHVVPSALGRPGPGHRETARGEVQASLLDVFKSV